MFGIRKKQEIRPHTAAVIVAAGSSTRMGGQNKLLLPVAGIPVLARTLLAFAQSDAIDDIVLVCRAQDFGAYKALLEDYAIDKVRAMIAGGETRAHSVQKGLLACETAEIVAIHDGARPLVAQKTIADCVAVAVQNGAAAPVVAMKDSIKRVREGIIEADVPRHTIAAVQTPQTFRRALIVQALEQALADNAPLTDDCAAIERMGLLVHAVEGTYQNMKITTPEDICVAEALLEQEEV